MPERPCFSIRLCYNRKERRERGWSRKQIIRTQLFALRDETYRTFHSALMPTVPPETVIGVRVPALRKLAKQLAGTAQAEVFLQALPHGYYEENNLHAFLIELIRDYDRALAETEAFLPYINNWATCDCFCPKVFAKHKKQNCWCPFAAGWIR